MAGVDGGGFRYHSVEPDSDRLDAARFEQLVYRNHDLLRASDREDRTEYLATPPQSVLDEVLQLLAGLLPSGLDVLRATIGGFDD